VKRIVLVVAIVAVAFGAMHAASAVTHQATIGNYYYEDDTQRDQTKIVVRQGDQVTFTVRQAAVPGHTVDVDALNIHSPNLNLGQTYTTPPLTKPGNFYLYCRPHEDRGHHTRLVVLAAPAVTASPRPTSSPRHTATPPHIARPAPQTPAPVTHGVTPAPSATLTPVGVGTAPPGALNRPVPTNPNSLNALTGRKVTPASWTRSLWWLLVAAVPIIAAGAVALQRARVAQYQPKIENLRRAREAMSKPQPKPRKPGRKR
jgi:plastocyanin